MPDMPPAIISETAHGLTTISLSRPPLNLLGTSALDELAAEIDRVAGSRSRALLIRAEGDIFSGGVDVADFRAGPQETPEQAADRARANLKRYLATVVQPLEALPMPTVAAVDGLCLTAGFELALACDFIVASDRSQFGLVEASLGLTPAMGGTQRLAARAGVARAAELVMTARLYDSATLHGWGVVSRVLGAEGFDAQARRQAAKLAAGPTRAHAATKHVLAAFSAGGVPAADAVMPTAAAALFVTEDVRAGVVSFLNEGPGKATFVGA